MEHKEQVRTVVTEEHHFHCDCCGLKVEAIRGLHIYRPRHGALARIQIKELGSFEMCRECQMTALVEYIQKHRVLPQEV